MPFVVSNKFVESTTCAATTTSALPSRQIPPNCHTIIIYNPDDTNDVYVAIGQAADVLDPTGVAAGSVVPSVGPPNGSLTIGMGPFNLRPNSSQERIDQLVYATSAGSVQVNITYINANQY